MKIPVHIQIWLYLIFLGVVSTAVASLEIVHILYVGHLHVIGICHG